MCDKIQNQEEKNSIKQKTVWATLLMLHATPLVAGPLNIIPSPLNIADIALLDSSQIDWGDGKDRLPQSLAITFKNINDYYHEAEARIGGLPSRIELEQAKLDYLRFLAINGSPVLYKAVALNVPADNPYGWSSESPDIPLSNRTVSAVNPANGLSGSSNKLLPPATWTKPLLPPMRFTRDGRVGIVGSIAGYDAKPNPLVIQLNRPEQLKKNLLESKASLPSMSPDIWREYDLNKYGMPGAKTTHSVMICEPKPTDPAKKNPYKCGVGGKDDCYDFTFIADAVKYSYVTSRALQMTDGVQTQIYPQLEKEDRLYSREMRIRVSNPKTPHAKIAAVDISSDYKVAPTRIGLLFEPTLPLDGRLIVGRRTGIPLVWRHTTSNQVRVGDYENVYSVAPESSKPCDVTQWGEWYPLSHAPFDPRMKRYDFAKYQFRDPMGNYIPDGAEMKGTYPWVSMDGKMMTMQMSDADLYNGNVENKSNHRYKNELLFKGVDNAPNIRSDIYNYIDKSNVNQTVTFGAWTKGKMVLFDNSLNFADYKIPYNLSVRLNDIYKPGSALPSTENKSSSVDIYGSREQSFGGPYDVYPVVLGEDGKPMLDEMGSPYTRLFKNTQFFESIENRLVYNKFMRPGIPADVSWMASNGANSLALNFDDMLNENAFIISDMVAAYSWDNPDPHRFLGYDGWNVRTGDWRGQVKVQNAATTLPEKWVVPAAGDVAYGRIEPVANGGVKGKGMYFNGSNTRIIYEISPRQPRSMSSSYWFHSVFLDSRGLSSGQDRVLLDFPDKSRLTASLNGSNVALKAYNNHGELAHTVNVPSTLFNEKWLHLGLKKAPSNKITVYINGFAYSDFQPSAGSVFGMAGGKLALGKAENQFSYRFSSITDRILNKSTATPAVFAGFRGWMDEYKVFAYEPDHETICNLAHGTLVATGFSPAMISQASIYPKSMHDQISSTLVKHGKKAHARYACYMNNPSKEQFAKLHSLPSGSISIRNDIHFPEGPIYHNAPRPNSSNNAFCLSCHSSNNKISGLTTNALTYRDIPAKLDPRRMPSQPPAWITGNLPPEFLSSINSNPEAAGSVYLDEHTLPAKK